MTRRCKCTPGAGGERCPACRSADEIVRLAPRTTRTAVDNAVAAAFRKVIGWDPERDGAAPGTLFISPCGQHMGRVGGRLPYNGRGPRRG